MKSSFLLRHLAPCLRVPACSFVVAFSVWALPLAAQAAFTNQAPPAVPGVYDSVAAWGDYDNDGRLDFVLTGLDDGDVPLTRIFRNQGGTFVDSGTTLSAVYSSAVAWGDYDNDGNLDLLVAGATSLDYPYAPLCRLYHNEGNGQFGVTEAGLPGVYAGAVAWGDYDKDGDLDLVITGWTDTGRISRIYRNDGGGLFVDSGIALTSVGYGSVAWGDYNKDGYLDLVLCGSSSSGRITRLYRNNADGTFSDSGVSLTGVTTGCLGWGDYDNDGDLDLFLTGSTGSARISQIYTNHGNGSLSNSGNVLTGLASSAGAWADYNNDGNLDLFLMGDNAEGPVSLLYLNGGNGTFIDSGIELPGLASGSVAWGDYDNSGQIDLLLTGFDTSYTAAVFLGRNNETTANQSPLALTSLTTRLTGRDVTLSWDPGSDDHTPRPGLHYNLRLGTISRVGNRVPPLADPTNGFRRVVAMGNGGQTNFWTIKGLPDGTYYWSVQTIDTAFAGGPFVTEAGFSVPNNPPTDISLNPAWVDEGQPIGTTLGKLAASDLNADDTHIYTLVAGAGDADNSAFTVVGDELKTAVIFDFETRSSYRLRVRATDPAGLYCEKAFTVTVLDGNEPPEARCQDVTVEAGTYGTAFASVDNGSFDRDAGDAVALTQSPPGPYPVGTNLITLVVTDSRGASNLCVATVTVRDVTPPVLSCPPSLRLEAPADQCAAVLNYYPAVMAWDNCDPSPLISSVPPAGALLPVGPTNLVVTASDASGNTTSCTFTVSVYPAGTEVAGLAWTRREPPPAPEPRAWRSVACSASGVVLAAVDGGRLHVSRDYGATWAERGTVGAWQGVASSSNGSKLAAVVFGGYIYTSSDFGETWTPRSQPLNWSAIACSADGTRMVAAVYGGYLYTSTNSGVNWTPCLTEIATPGWVSVACSAGGETIAAAIGGGQTGQIYVSTDFGVTWTPCESSREWVSVACSAGGDFIVAAATGGQIYTSIDRGLKWDARASDRAWSAVACSQYYPVVAAEGGPAGGLLFTSTNLGQTWTGWSGTTQAWSSVAVSPAGDVVFAAANNGHIYSSWDRGATWDVSAMTRFWQSIASSADGAKLVAVVNGGQVYTSEDAGVTWVPRQSNRSWSAVASSVDGTKLVATVNGGQIYTSSDSGTNWTPHESNRAWQSVACSADGTKLIAVVYGGQVYTSTNQGVSWTPRQNNRNWSGVSCSADGTRLMATVYGGQIFISADSGLTWAARESNRSWSSVACSVEGTQIIAAVAGGQLFISANSGLTWTARESNRQWSAVASSADGAKLAAMDRNNGNIYLSTDAGLTWTGYGANRNWQTIACSADGRKLAAGVYGGRIYTSLPTVLPPAPPTILGATNRVVGATSSAGAVVDFAITATNKCQSYVPVICTPLSGSTFPLGTNTVTCVAVDAFDVRVTNSFTVAVVARPEQGGWGRALVFDGVDDHAAVPNLVLSNMALTIELWAKRDGSGTWDAFVAQGTNSADQGLLFAFQSDNRVVFSFSAADLCTTNTYTDSAWHHWAATYDPASGRCVYLDGILVASDTNTAPYAGTGSLFIGAIPWRDDGAFEGALDDLRIWSQARTQDQIRMDMLHPLAGLMPSLVAYWNFNDGQTAAIVRDITLNGHDGTLVSTPARPQSAVPPWGYALLLDGVDDYVDVPDGVYFNGDLTIEAWVYARSYNYWSRILDFGNGAPSDNVILALSEQTSGKPALCIFSGGSGSVTAPAPIPTNQWVHLAATLKGTAATLYVNGINVASSTVTPPNPVIRTNNYIGRSAWSGVDGFLAASLDEVRIWNVARSQTEILAGLGHPLTGFLPNLVARWSFDDGAGSTVFDSTPNLLDGSLVNEPLRVTSSVGQVPTVTTLLAFGVISDATNARATLNGLVNPNVDATTAWFEWGTTTSYGNRTPNINIDSGAAAVACSNLLAGLTAGETYHFRLVAENSFGRASGGDQVLSPITLGLNGANPLLSQIGAVFADPGFTVSNPADLQLGAQKIAAGAWHQLALRTDGILLGWGRNDSGQISIPANATNVIEIAGGGSHSLAITSAGRVIAWGNNNYGQAAVPAAATNAIAVSAGYFHSLALRRDGTAVGWGAGSSGQFPHFGQAVVPPWTDLAAVAAGGYHSLGLRSNGVVVAWGLNNEGQLNIPAAAATNVMAIAAGHGHNLALRSDGRVVGWGNNIEGQANVPPAATSNVLAIAANGWHSLALKNDGTVVAWGAGTNNTGTGLSFGQSRVPANTSNVVALAAGIFHSLALRPDGSVIVWGDNSNGQTQGLSIVVSGVVNTNRLGLYTLSYAVTNAYGWGATTTRTVRVGDRPGWSAQPVVNVTSGTVALRSFVNPNGAETHAWFQWGDSSTYANVTVGTNLGDGFDPVSCSILVTDLIPEATYHYRAVASNSFGVMYGPDAVFTVFSTDPNLASLALSEGVLNPVFAPEGTNYAVAVPNEVGYLMVTPASADDGATIGIRVNGSSYTPVGSGSPGGPLFLGTGLNSIEVQVTAQDGVTRKTYTLAVTRAPSSGVLVGPSFPPPLGVLFNQSGTNEDGQIGWAAGKTWYFSGATLASQAPLFWGATNDGVKLSFNDSLYETNEIMVYQPALSGLANGIVVWAGQTLTPPKETNIYTRFMLAVTNTDTGTAIPLIEAASLGLPANIGAVLRVTPGLRWQAVLRFQASLNPDGPFEPALAFFERVIHTNRPTAVAYSSFGAGFYNQNTPPVLTANNPLTVDRGLASPITSGLLAASDLESSSGLLRFTIAPQGQGGPPRNGTLSLGDTNLAAGDSFTQDDIFYGRVLYTHNGNCETNDDFTFNVTDQHGGATPTGEHTTYTFRITIAQPNLPPVALSASASTGLQAPYQGFLPATNADCTPQTLSFRLVGNPPAKGDVTLNTNTGAFTYTPRAGEQGFDSFTFQVSDGFISSRYPGTFTITISNQPPVAIAASGATRENLPFGGTLSATDPDRPAQALTYAIASDGTKGTAVITDAATGGFVYTPQGGAIGADTFTFTAGDGILVSAPGIFTVNIRPNLEEGDLLVSDGGAKQIVLVDPTGAQGVVSSGGLIADPRGLAFDPGGTIVLLDGANGLIRVDPADDSQVMISSSTNFSSAPLGAWGIALEPEGSVLVADGTNGVVRVNPTNGVPTTLAVSNHLALPVAVALSPEGAVYVGDAAGILEQSSRIVRIDRNTGTQTLVSSADHLLLPTGIAFDNSDNLLVTEAPTVFGAGSDLVLRINATNGNQTVLTTSNLLSAPIGIARASAGTLYVVNMLSASLVAIDPDSGTQALFSSGAPLVRPTALTVVHFQAAPGLIVGIQAVSGRIEVQYLGLAGRFYGLERSVDLVSWQQVTNAAAASDGVAYFTDLNPPSGSAFYRVRLP